MPHIQIDYSANLEERLDVAGLCRTLRDVAVKTGVFPLAGIRVRAVRCDYWVIADGDPAHAFLDISVRLREGRPLEVRKRATEELFAAVREYCSQALASSSLMLSMEMREIDAGLAPKESSIRRYLAGGEG